MFMHQLQQKKREERHRFQYLERDFHIVLNYDMNQQFNHNSLTAEKKYSVIF